MACTLFWGVQVHGQSLTHAENMYNDFLKMMAAENNVAKASAEAEGEAEEQTEEDLQAKKVEAFRFLYQSYLEYQKIFRNAPRRTDNYKKAKNGLIELWPSLQNGAAQFQEIDPLTSTKFARAYVDVAMDSEMKDQKQMKGDPYYPTMVFYAGMMSYSKDNFRASIKYLSEYLDTGEETRKESAFRMLADSRKFLAEMISKSHTIPVDQLALEVPDFLSYLEKFREVENVKGEFETTAEFNKRINDVTGTRKSAIEEYTTRFYSQFSREELVLNAYDPDYGSYPIDSPYGSFMLKVPRRDNEAQRFRDSEWSGVEVSNPAYAFINNEVALSHLEFTTSSGNKYVYDINDLPQREAEADLALNPTPEETTNLATNTPKPAPSSDPNNIVLPSTRINMEIPRLKKKVENSFAVVIANERYDYAPNVPNALYDGEAFANYCELTLGMEKSHIFKVFNATFGKMDKAIRDIQRISRGRSGDMNVVFYYAGHGVPNSETKDAYLLPIDTDGKDTERTCYSLKTLYRELASMNANSCLVFLDACFSGASLEKEGTRGKIVVKPKGEKPQGNLAIFSAATDEQVSFPYKDEQHGLFTFFLLKKLHDTKGKVTLKELGDYVQREVTNYATIILKESQTPTLNVSPDFVDWEKVKLVP
ncbi:MAG: caspase family protein [Bacteroidaceae bacterium]|nr:caspase family protein [Bacteroidaceae bacterium]